MEAGLGQHQTAFALGRMTADPIWPAGPGELVLWAQLIAVWIIATYAIAPNYMPERGRVQGTGQRIARLAVAGAVAGSLGWLLPAAGTDLLTRVLLLATVAVFVLATALIRQRLMNVRGGDGFLAEFEIGANAGLMAATALVVGFGGTGWTATDTIVQSGKVTAIACAIAAVVAVFRCGTYVVRGVLNRTGAIPPREPEVVGSGSLPTTTELSRGRSIGNLERFLMIVAIGLGRYEVLGFLVAAKGLIRSREFENRAFAEYFILGTLASTAVALVVGSALRVSVAYFWGLEG